MFVDVHAHLEHEQVDADRDLVVEKCRKVGVKSIVCAGTDPVTNRAVLGLATEYDIVRASLGVYPLSALRRYEGFEEFSVDEEVAFIRSRASDVIAVGEVGMDFVEVTEEERAEQEEVFVRMIGLAKELDVPLVVHSRKAEREVVEVLKRERAEKVVLHCFMGSKQLVREAASEGFHFSIPPSVVRSSHFEMVVKEVNIAQLLTETDSPYLGPVRGERNDPSNVVLSVERIAALKGFDVEEVKKTVWLTYSRLFK